jgi:hypothetical protein
MSCDIAIALPPLALPDPNTPAEPYEYHECWPLDPNAPKIDDDFEIWEEDE